MRRVRVLLTVLASSLILSGQQAPPAPGYGQPQGQYPQGQYPQGQGQTPQGQIPQDTQAEPQDQPGQAVARLSVINGDASVRRGDSGDWVAAALNAPLMAGDSVAIAAGGSAELQLDYANFVRLGGDSEIRISQLENGRSQIQVAKGLVTWRVLRDSNAQSEISTPAVAVHPVRLSAVRVEVAPDGATRITVRRGDADVSTPRGNEHLREGNMMLVRGGADDPEYQVVNGGPRDAWDTWNDQRDSYLERSQSNRYVSQDINGAEDLDAYGRWGYDAAYGNVWTPTVDASWAPYRNGQWVWEDYYGWTWVDYSPWGWAPFHYGSWYFRTGYGWSWFPGQRYGHYWWHPAMVGFFGFGGGVGVGFGFGNVGWIPLAPFEAFHPWYGRGWYGGGRFGVINNIRNTNIINVYRNARFGNGVSAVSAADFQRGSFRNQVEVNRGQLQQASLVRGVVPVTPTANNLRFSERNVAAGAVPRGTAGNQRFFSRMPATAGATQRTPFVQQQAAARSAFSGGGGAAFGGREAAQSPAGASGWRRFGEPSQAQGTAGVQPRGFQAGGSSVNPAGNAAGNQGASVRGGGPGWDRFGSPQASPQASQQRQAAPAPQGQYSRPGGYGDAQGYRGQSRSVQVAPPIVQQRAAPGGGGGGNRAAPAPSFRGGGAPQGNRGGGGGGGGRPSGGGQQHGGRR